MASSSSQLRWMCAACASGKGGNNSSGGGGWGGDGGRGGCGGGMRWLMRSLDLICTMQLFEALDKKVNWLKNHKKLVFNFY